MNLAESFYQFYQSDCTKASVIEKLQRDVQSTRDQLQIQASRNHGPNNISGFNRIQMAMDSISWILYSGSEHQEFNVALTWLAEFLKYLCGFTTQDEEDWLDEQCSSYYVDLIGRPRDSRDSKYLECSKSLERELRHNKKKFLFCERGSMNIADLFGEMGGLSPKQYGMSGAQFAAFCCAIPSRVFFR